MTDSEDELVVLTDISSPSLDALKDLLREDGVGEAPEFAEGHQNPELRGLLTSPVEPHAVVNASVI